MLIFNLFHFSGFFGGFFFQFELNGLLMNQIIKEVLIWRKKRPGKVRAWAKQDLTFLLKNQNLFIWKYVLPPIRDPTFIKPGSRFGGTFYPHINVSSLFTGTRLFIKCMNDIFKDCRKTFDKKRNRNGSQINELVEQ